jgi:ornithine--oxo-acid transaminase
MSQDLLSLLEDRPDAGNERYRRCVNPQKVEMLRLVGMDVAFVRAEGGRLTDSRGVSYLDTVTHSGVSSIGHNHPHVAETLRSALGTSLPNMVQMHCSPLAARLAERLLARTPHLGKVLFGNSGAEAVEAALKLSRGFTGRSRILAFEGAYHGLTYGALSCVGHEMWRDGFGPFLPGVTRIPFNDPEALARELAAGDVACLLGETILGDGGVVLPDAGFWPAAAELCRRHGSVLVLDEIQVGMGRTGRFHAFEHYGVEPDILLLGKSLSGGQAPISAVLMRDEIHAGVFSGPEQCLIHFGTFSENNLAMAAGLAALDVLESEDLCQRSAETGRQLLERMAPLGERYEMVRDVRGLGLIAGIELGRPRSLRLRMGWDALDRLHPGLIGQMVVMSLFRDHRIFAQLGGHNVRVLKLMPVLAIPPDDVDHLVDALDRVLAACHRFPSRLWAHMLDLARRALT